MAFHINKIPEKYKYHYFKKIYCKPMLCRKMGARLNFIEYILYFCMNIIFCFRNYFVFIINILYKKINFSFKNKYHIEK